MFCLLQEPPELAIPPCTRTAECHKPVGVIRVKVEVRVMLALNNRQLAQSKVFQRVELLHTHQNLTAPTVPLLNDAHYLHGSALLCADVLAEARLG
jgi:hypothetical protein